MRGWLILRPVLVVLLLLLLLCASTDTVSAQLPAKVETPYTLMDAERRTFLEDGIETPLKGNGPLTGYGYLFFTRPHFLDEDLYLRLVIPPGYLISELVKDHWPSQNSAVGHRRERRVLRRKPDRVPEWPLRERPVVQRRLGRGGTLAYYLRSLKIGGLLPAEGQVRVNPKYVWYDRTNDTSRQFRLPENTAIYDMRAGIRLELRRHTAHPNAALELSVWQTVSYRDNAGRYGSPGHR